MLWIFSTPCTTIQIEIIIGMMRRATYTVSAFASSGQGREYLGAFEDKFKFTTIADSTSQQNGTENFQISSLGSPSFESTQQLIYVDEALRQVTIKAMWLTSEVLLQMPGYITLV